MSMESVPLKTCMGCAHHYITHDANFRYGCKAFGFKSREMPMRVVLQSSGERCKYFAPKQRKSPTKSLSKPVDIH